jgi:SAM-dependent methyltransferase
MKKIESSYQGLSTKEVFTKIYEEGAWGSATDTDRPYYSGGGSHDAAIVGPYVDASRLLLASYSPKPDVLDVGCGDFRVGSQLRNLCDRYTACDIVEQVIDDNRKRYADLNVDFKVLDLTSQELPTADVVFVRQVFQHLSNAQILACITQIQAKWNTLVVTEALPTKPDFVPNLDKPVGPEIRLPLDSGVVLTSPPFNLVVRNQRTICEVPASGGVIKTIVYTLA